MAFLTSTNVTWRKENLAIFVNLLFNHFEIRVVMEVQNDTVNNITIIS